MHCKHSFLTIPCKGRKLLTCHLKNLSVCTIDKVLDHYNQRVRGYCGYSFPHQFPKKIWSVLFQLVLVSDLMFAEVFPGMLSGYVESLKYS